MESREIFEAIMLICFGASWPVSAYKSLKSKKTGSKSLIFLCLICFGYIVGLIGKIIFNPGYVIAIYSFNLFFVTADLLLYFRNKRFENRSL